MSLFPKFLISVAVFASCSRVSQEPIKMIPKKAPQYQGVDAKLQSYVDDFMNLSAENHIAFKHPVTIGIKTLGYPQNPKKKSSTVVIGLCNYGKDWREIDIDADYWEREDDAGHRALLYHELIHCYCGRNHDYGKDKPYPDANTAKAVLEILTRIFHKPPEGYFDNGPFAIDVCPISIMHPIVVDSYCWKEHRDHYEKEMFDRCEPW